MEPLRLGLKSAHGETNGIFTCNYVMKDVGFCISMKKYKEKIATFPFNHPFMAISVYKVHLNAPWSPCPTVCVNFPNRWQKQWVHKWHQHMVQTLYQINHVTKKYSNVDPSVWLAARFTHRKKNSTWNWRLAGVFWNCWSWDFMNWYPVIQMKIYFNWKLIFRLCS